MTYGVVSKAPMWASSVSSAAVSADRVVDAVTRSGLCDLRGLRRGGGGCRLSRRGVLRGVRGPGRTTARESRVPAAVAVSSGRRADDTEYRSPCDAGELAVWGDVSERRGSQESHGRFRSYAPAMSTEETSRFVRLRVELVLEVQDDDEVAKAALRRIAEDPELPEGERTQAEGAVTEDTAEALAYLVDPFDLVSEVPGVEPSRRPGPASGSTTTPIRPTGIWTRMMGRTTRKRTASAERPGALVTPDGNRRPGFRRPRGRTDRIPAPPRHRAPRTGCPTDPRSVERDGPAVALKVLDGGSRGFRDSATMEKLVMTDSKRRRGLAAASALLGGVLVLTACSGGDDASGGGGDASQAKVDAAAARSRPRRRSRSRRRTAPTTPRSTTPPPSRCARAPSRASR